MRMKSRQKWTGHEKNMQDHEVKKAMDKIYMNG